jgi:hypothetical protein
MDFRLSSPASTFPSWWSRWGGWQALIALGVLALLVSSAAPEQVHAAPEPPAYDDTQAPQNLSLDSPGGDGVTVTSDETNGGQTTLDVTYSYTDASPSDVTITLTRAPGEGASYDIDDSGYAGDNTPKTVTLDLLNPDTPIGNGLVGGETYDIEVSATDANSNNKSLTETNRVTIDNQEPLITTVTRPTDGLYGIGETLEFTVEYDEAVNVDQTNGTPSLDLDIGGATKEATFASGDDSKTLTFTYVVEQGPVDTDGIAFSPESVQPNGGTLKDDAGNNAEQDFNAEAPSLSGVDVDGKRPSSVTVDAPTDSTFRQSTASLNVDYSYNENYSTQAAEIRLVGSQDGTVDARFNIDDTGYAGDNTPKSATLDLPSAYSGAVDPGTTYDLRVTAIDEAGNPRTATGTDLLTVDDTAPTVTAITRSSPTEEETNQTSVTFAVSFSELVESIGTGDFALDNNTGQTATIASVSASSGRSVTVTVDDVSGNGTLGLDVAPNTAQDRAGNTLSSTEPMPDDIYLIDNGAPVLTTVTTDDADGNGQIDQLTLTFDEDVTVNDGAGDGLPGYDITSPAYTIENADYGASGVTSLTLQIQESGSPDTDETPTITYTQADGNNPTVADAAGNEQPDQDDETALDRAPPSLIAGTTDDSDNDGQIDQLTLDYSEPIAVTDGNASDGLPGYTVGGSYTIADADYAPSGSSLTIGLQEKSNPDTDAIPTVTYDQGTSNGPTVDDLVDNEQIDQDSQTPADGAAPTIVSSETGDGDGNGQIDRITLQYSEPVTITDGDDGNPLPGYSVPSPYSIAARDYGGSNVPELTLRIAESGSPDTDATPTVTYDRTVTGTKIVADAAGNEQITETPTPADRAPPVPLTAEAVSGKTPVTVEFSEGVSGSSGALSAGDFDYNDDSGDGAGSITGVSHTDGERTASVTLDAGVEADDLGTDKIGSASIVDGAGNAAAGTATLQDTQPPANPVATSGGTITAANASSYSVDVTLKDDHEAGTVAVKLDDGATPVKESTGFSAETDADSDNPIVTVSGIDASTLAEGSVTITAEVTDYDNNKNLSNFTASSTVTKDTEGPSGPLNLSATAVAGGDIELSWDDIGDGATTYSVRRKETSAGSFSEVATVSDENFTGYNYTDPASDLTDGTAYDYVVVPIDGVGNEGSASAEQTATADGTPPTISEGSVAGDNSSVTVTFSEGVYANSGGVEPLTTEDLSAVLTRNGGAADGVSITGLTKTDGSTDLSGGESKIQVQVSVSNGPASGEETVEIQPENESSIYDEAGNAMAGTETTGPLTLNDRKAPANVTVDAPTTEIVRKSSQTVDVSYSYDEADPADATVTFADGNGNSVTFDVVDSGYAGDGSPKSETLNLSSPDGSSGNGLQDGTTYDLTVTATDGAGNSDAQTETGVLTIDDTAPTISSVKLGNDGSGNLDFSFQTNEALGADPSDVAVSVDGPNTSGLYSFDRSNFTEAENSGTFTYTLDPNPPYDDGDGQYVASVDAAVDEAGNDGATGQSDTFTLDTNAPTASIDDPTDGALVQSQNQISGSASDNLEVSAVELTIQRASDNNYWDGSSWVSGQTTVPASAEDGTFDSDSETWTYDASSITGEDTYEVVATAIDGTGNEGSSSPVSYEIDTTPPTIASAKTLDRDDDGRVDAADVTFSEPIDDNSLTASNYAIGGTAASSFVTGATADDTKIQLQITQDGGNEVTGTETKQVTYSGTTADLAGNVLATVSAGDVTETDGAAPVIRSATTADGNGNGEIDAIDLQYSEAVDVTDGNGSDGLPGYTVDGYTITNKDYGASGTTSLTLELQESGSPDTDATPTVSYSQSDSNSPTIADAATNEQIDGDSETPADGAAPEGPMAPVATARSGGDIEVTWDDIAETAEYELQRSTLPGGPYNTTVKTVTDDAASEYSVTDTGLSDDTEYFYVVVPVDGASNVGFTSSEASATSDATAPTSPALAAPADSTFKQTSQTLDVSYSYTEARPDSVTISFADGSGNTAAFGIDDSGYAADGTQKTVTLDLSAPTNTAGSGLTGGATYDLTVTAIDSAGNSTATTGSGRLTIDDTPPQLQAATIAADNLVLTYDEILDAGSVPATGAFKVNGTDASPSATDITTDSVVVELSTAVLAGDDVTVDYTGKAGSSPIRDRAKNEAANLTGEPVTNNTEDTTAPTISSFPGDQTIDEDQTTETLSFTVDDNFTAPADLAVSATSDDPDLVPDDSLTLGGSGTDRTIAATPVADSNGTAQITVTVEDENGNDATAAFTLTVNPVSDAPTIDPIADQTIDEDNSTGALSVTVGDVETPASDLVLSATSDNPDLVPDANLALGGSGTDRTIEATPAADSNGTAQITVTVEDGDQETANTAFTLTVNAVNDAPTISAIDDQTINEDNTTGAISFTIGDVETAASALTLSATSDNQDVVPDDSLTLAGSGENRSITATPTADSNGTATLTVTADDGNRQTTETYLLTVDPVNDAPVVVTNAPLPVRKGDLQSIEPQDLTTEDVESPPADLVYNVLADSPPTKGRLLVNGTQATSFTQKQINEGAVQYEHTSTTTQDDTFDFTVTDQGGSGLAATGTFTVTITTNSPPTAQADTFATDEDETLVVADAANGVLTNDSDPDRDDLQASLVTNPSDGSLTLNGDGTFTYDPAPNVNGSDQFDYRAGDGAGGADTTSVTLIIRAVNDTPQVATNDGLTLDEGASKTISASVLDVSDPDDDASALTYTVESVPANGTLRSDGTTLSSGDTFTQAAVNSGTLAYAHDGSETTSDSFDFSVADDGGASTETATFSITVTPVNDTPVLATNAGRTVAEGADSLLTTQQLQVTDAESGPSALTYTVETRPANGALIAGGDTLANGGTFSQANVNDSTVVYAHDGSETTSDSFDLSVTDEGGASTETATFSITVTPVNDAPTVATNDGLTLDEGASKTISASVLDVSDPDDDASALTYTVESVPANGTLRSDGTTLSSGDTFTQAAVNSGTLAYAHDGSETTSDSFDFSVADDDGAATGTTSFSISISLVNASPVASDDAYTTDEDETLVVADAANGLFANDSDPDGDDLQASIVTNPSDGNLTLNGDGTFTYEPATNFNGSDRFAYRAGDGAGGADTAAVDLTIRAVNDTPAVTVNDTLSLDEAATITIQQSLLSASDVESGPANLTYQLTTAPTNGTLTVSGDTLNVDGTFTQADINGGAFTYAHDGSETTSDRFDVVVTDQNGLSTDTARVPIDITPVNNTPVLATNAGRTVAEGADSLLTTQQLQVTDAESGPSALTYTVETRPANGALIAGGDTLANGGTFSQANVNDSTVVYAHDDSETTSDSFDFVVTDGGGETTNTKTFSISVIPVNEPPSIATNAGIALDEGRSKAITTADLRATDPDDGTSDLTYTVTESPSQGRILVNGEAAGSFKQQQIEDRAVQYEHTADTPDNDQFTFDLTDASGAGPTGRTFAITVRMVNVPPTASDDEYVVKQGQTLSVADSANGVLGNDSDEDGHPLNATLVDGPTKGALTLNPNGTFEYTPASGFDGTDAFTYEATDGFGGTSQATVDIQVRPDQTTVTTTRTFPDPSEQRSFRLIAAPGAVNTPLGSTLSGEAGDDWKAFRENGLNDAQSVSRAECGDGTSCRLRPGTGFWLVSRSSWAVADSFQTVSLSPGPSPNSPVYRVPLQDGWNIISNPVEKDVSWSAVQAASGTNQPLWRWDGSWKQTGTLASATSGTAYYFMDDDIDELVLPFPSLSPRRQSVASAKDAAPDSTLALHVVQEGDTVSTARVGLRRRAEPGLDRTDRFAPPGYFETVALRLVERDGKRTYTLASEHAPPGREGYTFDLRLQAPDNTALDVVPSGTDAFAGQEIALVRRPNGRSHALESDSAVTVVSRSSRNRFRLLAGSEQFVREQKQAIAPSTVKMLPNYPNPFHEATTLEYTLPERQQVRIAIYDVMGRRVRVLVNEQQQAGFHQVQWRVGNGSVASGVYFARLRTGNATKVERIVVVH